MTESQLAAINDIINTPNAGDYLIDETSITSVGDIQYDVPMGIKKNDPTLQRGNGKCGSTSIPKKKV